MGAIGRKFEVAFSFLLRLGNITTGLHIGPLSPGFVLAHCIATGRVPAYFGLADPKTWFDAAEEQRSTTNVGAEGFQRRWEPPFLDLSLVILLKTGDLRKTEEGFQMVRSGF